MVFYYQQHFKTFTYFTDYLAVVFEFDSLFAKVLQKLVAYTLLFCGLAGFESIWHTELKFDVKASDLLARSRSGHDVQHYHLKTKQWPQKLWEILLDLDIHFWHMLLIQGFPLGCKAYQDLSCYLQLWCTLPLVHISRNRGKYFVCTP